MNSHQGKTTQSCSNSNSKSSRSGQIKLLSGKKRRGCRNEIQMANAGKEASEIGDQKSIQSDDNSRKVNTPPKKRETKREQKQDQAQLDKNQNFEKIQRHSGYLLFKKEVFLSSNVLVEMGTNATSKSQNNYARSNQAICFRGSQLSNEKQAKYKAQAKKGIIRNQNIRKVEGDKKKSFTIQCLTTKGEKDCLYVLCLRGILCIQSSQKRKRSKEKDNSKKKPPKSMNEVGDLWQNLSDEEKQKYIKMAAEDAIRFQHEQAKFKEARNQKKNLSHSCNKTEEEVHSNKVTFPQLEHEPSKHLSINQEQQLDHKILDKRVIRDKSQMKAEYESKAIQQANQIKHTQTFQTVYKSQCKNNNMDKEICLSSIPSPYDVRSSKYQEILLKQRQLNEQLKLSEQDLKDFGKLCESSEKKQISNFEEIQSQSGVKMTLKHNLKQKEEVIDLKCSEQDQLDTTDQMNIRAKGQNPEAVELDILKEVRNLRKNSTKSEMSQSAELTAQDQIRNNQELSKYHIVREKAPHDFDRKNEDNNNNRAPLQDYDFTFSHFGSSIIASPHKFQQGTKLSPFRESVRFGLGSKIFCPLQNENREIISPFLRFRNLNNNESNSGFVAQSSGSLLQNNFLVNEQNVDVPEQIDLAFYHFSVEETQKMITLYPQLSNSEIDEKVCKNWQQMSEEGKRYYRMLAIRNKHRYLQQMNQCQKESGQKDQQPLNMKISNSNNLDMKISCTIPLESDPIYEWVQKQKFQWNNEGYFSQILQHIPSDPQKSLFNAFSYSREPSHTPFKISSYPSANSNFLYQEPQRRSTFLTDPQQNK